jgi:dipeptidyl aminopeptidase/acylaminoacyl peptidase
VRTFLYTFLLTRLVLGSGPQDRQPTDPGSLVSKPDGRAAPVAINDLYFTRTILFPVWSPDGSEIAYVSNVSGRLNLWKMKADGTGAHQLLHSNDAQSGTVWSPDGKWIIFKQDHGGDEMYDLYRVSSDGGTATNLTNTDQTREENTVFSKHGGWLAFDSKRKADSGSNIAVLKVDSQTPKLLTHETDPQYTWHVAFWSPDEKYIYATRLRLSGDDSDLYEIDIASGRRRNLTAHSGKVTNNATGISPDGLDVVLSSNQKAGFDNVALLDLKTGAKRWVTDTQWQASSGSFSPLGNRFVYALNADGRTQLFLADPKTLRSQEINLPAGINSEVGDPTGFSPDGSKLLVSHQDSGRPRDLWIVPVHEGQPTQLTHSAAPGLTDTPLPPSQIVHYKSFDGKVISAFVWLPFNIQRDASNPAVVYPHGGPTGQTADVFSATPIALASRGYVVIAPNVRGSTGYGLEFQNANHKDLGGGDLQDEVYAVKFLQATGFVDPKKVGITGGSYGGYMTLMAIGKTPDIWAAAASEYGIIDWITMLQHEDARLQEYEKSLLGDPEKDRAIYDAASPIKYIRNEKVPLLVLQGERDIRVPKEEAEQVVSILQQQGKTVEAKYYSEEGHGFLKRENQIDALTRIVNWFDKYLKHPL